MALDSNYSSHHTVGHPLFIIVFPRPFRSDSDLLYILILTVQFKTTKKEKDSFAHSDCSAPLMRFKPVEDVLIGNSPGAALTSFGMPLRPTHRAIFKLKTNLPSSSHRILPNLPRAALHTTRPIMSTPKTHSSLSIVSTTGTKCQEIQWRTAELYLQARQQRLDPTPRQSRLGTSSSARAVSLWTRPRCLSSVEVSWNRLSRLSKTSKPS